MTDKPTRCGAKTRAGHPCPNTPSPGATRCRMHGGASPQAKAKAAQRLAVAAAELEVAKLGARRDIHPAEALLELVHWTAGEVDYWRAKVVQLAETDEDALTWGTTSEVTKNATEFPGTDHTREAAPNVAYRMLTDASNRLAAYASAALKAGVDERRVRLAEQQGAQVAAIQRAILDRMLAALLKLLIEHGVTDIAIIDALHRGWAEAMSVIVPEELRRLAAGDQP